MDHPQLQAKPRVGLDSLPVELLEQICHHLPTPSLPSVAQVNSACFKAATATLWGREIIVVGVTSFHPSITIEAGQNQLMSLPRRRRMVYAGHIRRLHLASFGKSPPQTLNLLEELSTLKLQGLEFISIDICWQNFLSGSRFMQTLLKKADMLVGRNTKQMVLTHGNHGYIEHAQGTPEVATVPLKDSHSIERVTLFEQVNYVNAIEVLECMPHITEFSLGMCPAHPFYGKPTELNQLLVALSKHPKLDLVRLSGLSRYIFDPIQATLEPIRAECFEIGNTAPLILQDVLCLVCPETLRSLLIKCIPRHLDDNSFGFVGSLIHRKGPSALQKLIILREEFVYHFGFETYVELPPGLLVKLAEANPQLEQIIFKCSGGRTFFCDLSFEQAKQIFRLLPRLRILVIEGAKNEGIAFLRGLIEMRRLGIDIDAQLRAAEVDSEP